MLFSTLHPLCPGLVDTLTQVPPTHKTSTGENYGSWTKVIQKPNEPYVEFLARLKQTIERTVTGDEARKQLLKMLAYENDNEDCK